MQRDMDLVRQILMAIEATPEPTLATQPTIKGWTEKQVVYHLELLLEAELIKVMHTFQGGEEKVFAGISLTWTGQEFLAASRDDSRWHKAKTLLGGTFTAVTAKVLQDLLTSLIKSSAGMPP